jgi:hypothetical protein
MLDSPSLSLSDASDCDGPGPSWLTEHLRSMPVPDPIASLQSIPSAPEPPCLACLTPQCRATFQSEEDLNAHVKKAHSYSCDWAGCDHPGFDSRNGLIWHVKSEHLLVCPVPGCTETSFQSIRLLKTHIPIAHPEVGDGDIKEWQLPTPSGRKSPTVQAHFPPSAETTVAKTKSPEPVNQKAALVSATKRKCQEQLRSAVEKKTKRVAGKLYQSNTRLCRRALTLKGTPKSADSPSDMVRNRASRYIEMASFPMVFEHAVLPFLTEFMPEWSGPKYVVSVTRGRTPQARRISLMTRKKISRALKVTIAGHLFDLLPENFRHTVSFVFSEGKIERSGWARGLGKDIPDDICPARNPYSFAMPRMGDSIGIPGNDAYKESTATLGPCLVVEGGNYWLGNFHPFMQAYQSRGEVDVEHPSPQDRDRCLKEAHDAIAPEDNFRLGRMDVSSGFMLNTTRISHDPYWEENGKDQPLIVMDWALISADDAHANILRRFPSVSQPLLKEPLIKSTSAVISGASVVSSGRTSGYQRGQVCEIPAYVSGEENGTDKATREWFIEEPFPYDDEEAWIRGGIGVEGDSGAAIVDADTNCLIGQLWGRNRYWGPGPRQTFFTPIADIFDDIQEKCGVETRPQLPQERDDADRYAVYPSCRQCYDLRTYMDSRRSSRMSLQSMIMGAGDADQDLTSIEAVSELATPRDIGRFSGIEEVGSSFNAVLSPWPHSAHSPGTPGIADNIKSPYALNMDEEDFYDSGMGPVSRQKLGKRPVDWSMPPPKRHKITGIN